MMWRIEAPNNEYNGVTAGVTFVGGVGETGYTVAEVQADEPSKVADAAKPKKKTSAKDGE